jgi:CRP-like cAMP-binding protein
VQEPDAGLNRLLVALPGDARERWRAHLHRVDLPLGRVLYEAGAAQDRVWFPTTAIVSLLIVLADGGSSVLAIVGNDGVLGLCAIMSGGSTPHRAVVQAEGSALRADTAFVKDEFLRYPTVTRLLLRHTQAVIAQMAQTAACNRHHSVAQQLCRLLLTLDRAQGDELAMTQELIAGLLGVRREGVTEAALTLQRAGLIRYTRGHITVLDREGLERRSCECYAVVRNECDRLLPCDATRPAPASSRRMPGYREGHGAVPA